MNDLQVAVATTLGALLILVAAWLLVVRRDASQNSAKFLGLEFELSTPAIAVLLIGAGLLIGPAFAPRRPGGWPVLSAGPTSSSGAVSPGDDTILRQQTVMNSEVEPNDRPGEANVVAYGSTVSGKLSRESPVDQFIFNVSEGKRYKSRFIVRFQTVGNYLVYVSVLNNKEETLLRELDGQGTLSKSIESSSSYLIELIIHEDYREFDILYEITVLEEKDGI